MSDLGKLWKYKSDYFLVSENQCNVSILNARSSFILDSTLEQE